MSDTPAPEEKKVEHINLKVVGPDGGEVAFKIKKTTNLSKLMEAYATKTGQVFLIF
jgi:small ubiquitin-related modifier